MSYNEIISRPHNVKFNSHLICKRTTERSCVSGSLTIIFFIVFQEMSNARQDKLFVKCYDGLYR